MNDILKGIIISILILVACFCIYVSIDCFRLRVAEMGTKPIITVSSKKTENRVTYNGVGYSIAYYVDRDTNEVDGNVLIETRGYGAEFRLFGKILVWAWVE